LTDDRACGADDAVGPASGQMLRKLRFLMIDYSNCSARLFLSGVSACFKPAGAWPMAARY
jgi:hypothetical protein